LQSKKIVSFSDNLDEQDGKETCAVLDVIAPDLDKLEQRQQCASNDGAQDSGAQPRVSIGKWFRTLSYDNNYSREGDEERENEKQQQLATVSNNNNKPNESTPKIASNKSPNPSTTSKYQSFLSVNHQRNEEEAVVAGTKAKPKRNRRSNSLDSLKRTKKAPSLDANTNKVTCSAKMRRLTKSQSEKTEEEEEECDEINCGNNSKRFSIENVKQLLTNAKNKTLNLSNNVGATANTSFKDKVLSNSILNNLKSLKSKSPKNDDDDELHQTLIDNQENKNDCKNNESGEQILPQTKE